MQKIINYLKNNLILISTIIITIFLELFAITYTSCFPFLTNPFYPILILSLVLLIGSLVKRKRIRVIIYSIFLIIQMIINTGFIFLFDSNGTVFEWAMFNQRNDAYGTLETFEIKIEYIIISLIAIIIYNIFNHIIITKSENKKYETRNFKFKMSAILILISLIVSIPYIETLMITKDGYTSKLYAKTSNNYQRIGIVGNTFYQLIKGEEKLVINTTDDVDDFIYEDYILTSDYNGISSDNNLIVILVESMEWFPLELYKEYATTLYPNISRLMNDGLILNNFYQKEKTDVSETLAVTGNYPTGKYVNYDFYKNEYPFALPSLIKHSDESMIVNSFHANYGNFYNRYKLHQSWGFNQLYGIKEMNEYGVEDEWQHKKGERNLDSIAFEQMKELMFPTDKRFFSYILSFTMHGFYGERKNLSAYYEVIDNLKLFENKTSKMDQYLRTYMAAMMDFDKAMGIMLNYLETNNMLNNTTIVLYSDHNAYYNSLSNYAKDIEGRFTPELYRIPCIIYDETLAKSYKQDNKTNIIDKFTTTSDITPTILDIFGIKGWKNLYFGNSVFVKDVESIVYSRNYGFFVSEDFVDYSIDDVDLDKETLKDIEKRGLTHLKRLEYVDKIYHTNYFKDHQYIYTKEELSSDINCTCGNTN